MMNIYQPNWRIPLLIGAIALFPLAMTSATGAGAAEVRASLSSHQAYVGVPVMLRVEIQNAGSYEPPDVPDIPGTDVHSAGAPRSSSQTTIINGRMSKRSSIMYVWQITPRHEGNFTVPPLHVKVDGRFEATEPLQFAAVKSETGDLLIVEVSEQQDKVYVGQPLKLKLKIWLKPYHDTKYDLTLSEANMWRMVAEQTNWGAFAERMQELAKNRQRPGGEEVQRADANGDPVGYYLYEIETTIYPKRPGTANVGDVQVVVHYPTQLAKSRDPFSSFFDGNDFPFGKGSPFSSRDLSSFQRRTLTVADSRPLVASAKVDPIEVLPIPKAGRPADYRGAVGRYEIVTHAVPATVQAGDPITLQIGIAGTGPMDLVQAPPLALLPDLTKDFKVPDEPLAGIVQNGTKLFTVSIRPRRQGVTRIPAIPLSFFDPEKEKFVTVHSDPIAIEVSQADTLALGAIVGDAQPGGNQPEKNPASQDRPISVRFENFAGDDVLRSTQPINPGSLALVLLAPPLLWLGFALVRYWQQLGIGLAKFRTAAARSAYKALDTASSPADVAHALLGYIAWLFHKNPTTLTRDEAVGLLREHGIAPVNNQIDQLLGQCEQRAFAGFSGTEDASLVTKAKECIRWLNQQPFSRVPPKPKG